jgi:hypothetical protein
VSEPFLDDLTGKKSVPRRSCRRQYISDKSSALAKIAVSEKTMQKFASVQILACPPLDSVLSGLTHLI